MSKAFMYILECSDKSFYTGSTRNLEHRLEQHNIGLGAKYTSKRLPIKLVYYEEYERIDDAYKREKQIQGWNRRKKDALIKRNEEKLKKYSMCQNKSICIKQK